MVRNPSSNPGLHPLRSMEVLGEEKEQLRLEILRQLIHQRDVGDMEEDGRGRFPGLRRRRRSRSSLQRLLHLRGSPLQFHRVAVRWVLLRPTLRMQMGRDPSSSLERLRRKE